MKGRWTVPLSIFVLAFATHCAAIQVYGPDRELGSDSQEYLSIARSLQNGGGYIDTYAPWPDRPSFDRMPGWPAMLTAALFLSPSGSEAAVLRYTGAFCLALSGVFFFQLHRKLGIHPPLAALGGLAVSFSPVMVSLVLEGMSEVSALLVTVAGILCFLEPGPRRYVGAALLGFVPLFRTNFILVPIVFLTVALLFPGSRSHLLKYPRISVLGLLALAFLPTFAWTARNYTLTGRFPLLSSLEGETLYGANNEKVANDLAFWGTWIVPDTIPGESSKLELAQSRTELEMNDYYHAKGTAWIKANLSMFPRLVLGKLIRGFVPLPWRPVFGTWVAFSYRALLDVLFLVLIRQWWPAIDRRYLLLGFAMFLCLLYTSVVYYGVYRFTHVGLELFFIPCICLGVDRWLGARDARIGATQSNEISRA